MQSSLEANELSRFSRQIILPEIGIEGQQKLKDARVLCIGAGGLGSPLAMYLAAAGVGTIGIVDNDVVDISNLQRQILFNTRDVGQSKVGIAAERLRQLNPAAKIIPHCSMLTHTNAIDICKQYDIVVDGTDNFPTRYLVNDTCVLLGKPNVHASIFRFEGRASVFDATKGPCYRCLYPAPPERGEVPSCAEGGVLGVLPGLFGVIQATEAIKLILGVGEPLIGRIVSFDALQMQMQEFKLSKNPDCPICGSKPTIHELTDYHRDFGYCEIPIEADANRLEIGVIELKEMMDDAACSITLLDVREQVEWNICRIEGAIHVPKGELELRIGELNKFDNIVVYCLAGTRSRDAARFLRGEGFNNVRSLGGGIRAWMETIDPTLTRY